MIQDFTLHTHTNEFDGRNTAAEMIEAARASGFKTIGISNHFIVHPTIKQNPLYEAAVRGGYGQMYSSDFDEALSRFVPHYEELARLQDKNPDIRILRGMEVDYFPTDQWRDGFERVYNILRPDYLIGSAHFVEQGGAVYNVHDMAKATPDVRDQMLEQYWANIIKLAQSGLFNWLAHLDLPKKRGLGMESKWASVKEDAIVAIVNAKNAIEINTSGYKQVGDQPYPGPDIIKMVAVYRVPVLLSDDAHHISQIAACFETAYDMARQNGIKNFTNLQKILDFSKKSL